MLIPKESRGRCPAGNASGRRDYAAFSFPGPKPGNSKLETRNRKLRVHS